MTFTWDLAVQEPGETQEFQEAGFSFGSTASLSAKDVILPPKFNREVAVRAIVGGYDCKQFEELQRLSSAEHIDIAKNEFFVRHMIDDYRRMTESGHGGFFGAFAGEQLAAYVVMFRDGRICEYRDVFTRADFRRRGICRRLVYESAKHALGNWDTDTLLVDAEPDYHALGIYESLGFKRTETTYSLEWCAD